MSEQFIPRLFLPDYTQGNAEQKKQFSQQLGKAFNEVGFVTIANHGIDHKLIDDLYSEIQSFFALDENIKKKYERKRKSKRC
jgi:isopenicillin N synthase-like dioxygenase